MVKQLDTRAAYLSYVDTIKTTFGHDRTKTIGASEIMACARRVAYSKTGHSFDPEYVDANGFASRGNHMEAWIAGWMDHAVRAAGGELLHAGQDNQVTLVAEPLSVTPDGIAVKLPRDWLASCGVKDIGEGRCVVTEFKSISPRFKAEKLPKPQHVHQCMTQIGMVRHSTKHRPEYGIVVYVNSDDYSDIKTFVVPYDEKQFRALYGRAKMLISLRDPNQASPEGKVSGGDECRTCGYAKQCLGYLPWLQPFEVTPDDKAKLKTLKSLAAKKAKAEKAIAKAKAEDGKAEEALYAALADAKTRYVKHGSVLIQAKETPSQSRADAKKLAALAVSLGATPEQIEACKSATKPGTSLTVEVK